MRITTRFPWILLWIAENLKMAGCRVLRGACTGSRKVSPFGNGHHLRATPGTWEEPGDRSLARVPGPGGRRAVSATPGNWPAGAARPGRAPPSHTWRGPCLILPGRRVFCQDRHVGNRRNASSDDPGHGREQARGPRATAPRPAAVSAPAAALSPQTEGRGEHLRPRILARSHPGSGPELRVRRAGRVTQARAR
jgi:hypothetical protein